MNNEDRIRLYSLITEKYEVAADEIEKEFGINVGKQAMPSRLWGLKRMAAGTFPAITTAVSCQTKSISDVTGIPGE